MAGVAFSTLANYKDNDMAHEHTYFGNGGSTTVGTSYQTTTYDGETQKIGTYYNFQAATIGTGASLSTDGDQAPDSFCPNGWQLPIGNTQDVNKAFQKLLNSYNITSNAAGSIVARSYPPSYIFSGHYHWGEGRIYNIGYDARWQTNTVWGEDNTYTLYIGGNGIVPNGVLDMLTGLPLRCVSTY